LHFSWLDPDIINEVSSFPFFCLSDSRIRQEWIESTIRNGGNTYKQWASDSYRNLEQVEEYYILYMKKEEREKEVKIMV
jgi:hypothetical protein